MNPRLRPLALVLALMFISRLCRAANDASAPTPVPLPGGARGLKLDDLYFDRGIGKLVVPAGQTGQLDFIDPETRQVAAIDGFAAPRRSPGPVSGGLTSADGGPGIIFTTDRTDKRLYIVNSISRKIIGSTPLAGGPDYVRFVAPRREVWVTEPGEHQIEVFSLSAPSAAWAARHAAVITSSAPLEALAIDETRGRAYTNQGADTLVIDLDSRQIIRRWPNGCKRASGLALDAARAFLVVACAEGRAATLDAAHSGMPLSAIEAPESLDIIAFSPERSHVYLAGGKAGAVTIARLSDDGRLTTIDSIRTAPGAHCVAADNRGGVWLCDGRAGRVLYFKDTD